ncbi:Voldacs domain-containing protein [Kitasatospora sp. NPDC048298]|uniref:Voldacs domain-containing protein n=1 Tax=Kitasatospora sp. NPDC048298 TaxID=3364049 RepID=UPI00371ACBDF
MTLYSIDPDRRELIAAWGTGEGSLTTRVAVLPAEAGTSVLLGLARALDHLSDAAWRTYTHPASAAGSLEPNTEGWRREEERKHFTAVPDAIAKPNLPSGGSMVVSYSPLLESAHQIGRALHGLDNPELTKAILAETATELAAVENAELGDLAGRAQQAVLLSREDASPVQVAAADRLLEQNPFGSAELFSAVDPTAAAVAAAHWLAAAAEVTADASGHDPAQVVLEADNIEALPHETPTLLLGLIESGATPHEAVTGLVRHAMRIADGLLPDPAALREQLDDLEETLADYGDDGPDLDDVELRLTPLDPRRPARDLLEDLLTGIHACWLLHNEYDDLDDEDDDTSAEDWTDEQAEQHQQRNRERFAQLVRETAAHREPLI